MGIDCRIILPGKAQITDVADVLAILAGHTVTEHPLGGTHGTYAAVTPRPIITYPDIPGCMSITIQPAQELAESFLHKWLYHFEYHGNHLMMARSFAGNLAIGRALVQFFGGSLQYSDYDDAINATYPEQPDIDPESDRENTDTLFDQLQARKLALKPLTKAQIKAEQPNAAYS